MSSINVRLSAVGELADGTPVGYLFSDGNPVSLEVVDLCTGDLLDQHRIDPYTVASSIAVAEDGTVYLSDCDGGGHGDRKSTRLNSSHVAISYAVCCLKNSIL